MPSETTFITLGTAGGPVPKISRAQPAHALQNGGCTILIDCGEGAMRQLMCAGIDFRTVHDVFLSHHHFDHIASLFACLGFNMMLQRKTPLTFYGPPGTKKIIDALCAACDLPQEIGFGIPGQVLPHPRDFVQARDLLPGEVVKVGDIRISSCENTHYRAEDQVGQPGHISLSYRFDTPDRSVVFTGDTGPCHAVEQLAHGADLLVGELMDVEGTMARVRLKNPHMSQELIEMMGQHMKEHHLSPRALGELAAQVGVKQLVAVHIPLDEINADTAPNYIAQVAEVFSGEITIASDLDRF